MRRSMFETKITTYRFILKTDRQCPNIV